MPSPPQSRAANVLLHPQEPSPGPASPHLTAPPGAQVPITVLDLLRSPGNGGGAQRRPGVTIAVGSQRAEIAPRTGIPAPFADQACSSLVSLHLLYRILAERMPDPCRRASLPPAGTARRGGCRRRLAATLEPARPRPCHRLTPSTGATARDPSRNPQCPGPPDRRISGCALRSRPNADARSPRHTGRAEARLALLAHHRRRPATPRPARSNPGLGSHVSERGAAMASARRMAAHVVFVSHSTQNGGWREHNVEGEHAPPWPAECPGIRCLVTWPFPMQVLVGPLEAWLVAGQDPKVLRHHTSAREGPALGLNATILQRRTRAGVAEATRHLAETAPRRPRSPRAAFGRERARPRGPGEPAGKPLGGRTRGDRGRARDDASPPPDPCRRRRRRLPPRRPRALAARPRRATADASSPLAIAARSPR